MLFLNVISKNISRGPTLCYVCSMFSFSNTEQYYIMFCRPPSCIDMHIFIYTELDKSKHDKVLRLKTNRPEGEII